MKLVAGLLASFLATGLWADDVNRADPNFVHASLMIAGPGDSLFSSVGHSFIRLECETYKLDYCFSYESENARDRVASFLAGRLKMGLFAIPTEKFLVDYRRERRGIRQYPMNLPPAAKQELWRALDARAAEGAELPYDYNKRGCAKAALESILEALRAAHVPFERPRGIPALTRREKFNETLSGTHPWNLFILNAIVGTETDNFEPVVTPKDLLAFLQETRVEGRPVIDSEGREIIPQAPLSPPSKFTPLVATILFAALCLLAAILRNKPLTLVLLVIQALAGCFFLYLMTASKLPTSNWNWLIVPFNPLPLVFWRWRRYWARGYALALLAWVAFALLSPHAITDPAFLVLAFGFAVFYSPPSPFMNLTTHGES